MTPPHEVTVTAARYWVDKSQQLAQLLLTSSATVIPDPTGQPVQAGDMVVFTRPELWGEDAKELQDALLSVAEHGDLSGSRTSAGAVAPVEDRLVFTVEEAAQLLGISRSFAYEAVQRGDIPSMRIGRRILVPKAKLERFLEQTGESGA
jgi:excisionase family DNA binding protein